MLNKIKKIVFTDNKRTSIANKNALGSLLVKGISIVIGFLSIRLYLSYLGAESYGVWLTISSFYAWFTFFEFGLGNGLRNKLSQALSKKDFRLSQTYISTTYFLLACIVTVFITLFVIANQFIDWSAFLNVTSVDNQILYKTTNFVFILFFAQFFLKLISPIFLALQKTTLSYSINPLSNLICYLVVLVLYLLEVPASLVLLGAVLSGVPVIVTIIISIYFFKGPLKYLAPSIKSIDLVYKKDLLGIGINFFLIQISGLIMYQSSNFIISRFIGSEDVVEYNVAIKLTSILEMLFSILIAPLWSAYTEAWEKKDFNWIESTIKRNLKVWSGLFLLTLIVVLFSPKLYSFWLGDSIEVSLNLTFLLFFYYSLKTFGAVFVIFLNGISVLKMQLYCSLIGAIMFIPMAIFFINYLSFGVNGIVVAMIIANFYGPIIAPIQYHRSIIKAKSNMVQSLKE